MTAKDVVLRGSARQRVARYLDVLPSTVRARLGPRGRKWRARLAGARNIVSFVLLAAVFTWRTAVSWRRWQERHPRR